ncbi:MAG: DUF3631 domain-containing protein [Planctomycetes bacterium]|nr:DUF3631 domain-containing protein [Planctomycetota bacterium]
MTSDLFERILPRLREPEGPDARGNVHAWCPFHPDGQGRPPHRRSLGVHPERGFHCLACGAKGSLRNLAARLGVPTAIDDERPTRRRWRTVATYDYKGENGDLLYQVVRREDQSGAKDFRQRRPDGRGGWIWRLGDARRVLYRLPDLVARPGEAVHLVEGEKDADRLAALGLLATTAPMGAGKWRPEYGESLRGRDIIILPDNDEPGRRHAREVLRSLRPLARSVRVVELPGLPPKGDVSDWLDARAAARDRDDGGRGDGDDGDDDGGRGADGDGDRRPALDGDDLSGTSAVRNAADDDDDRAALEALVARTAAVGSNPHLYNSHPPGGPAGGEEPSGEGNRSDGSVRDGGVTDGQSSGDGGSSTGEEESNTLITTAAIVSSSPSNADTEAATNGLAIIDRLEHASGTEELEAALRDLGVELEGEDDLRRAVVRAEAIRRLSASGVRRAASMVDAALRGASGDASASGGAAHDCVLFEEVEPWPEPVDGAQLLDVLAREARRHLVLPGGAAEALAIWILFTHVHDAFTISPRLAITSPEKRCGKTRTLELLQAAVHRPLSASNISCAAVYRSVERYRPTLLIDEADTFLRRGDELRGVLNSGHNRAAAFVMRIGGDDHEPRIFSTWSPVAIALIGRLPSTLDDRSIEIVMQRRLAGERVARRRSGDLRDRLADARRRCVRWAADAIDDLRRIDPREPPELDDRAADNWRPLLAVADRAGGPWPERARAAALILSARRTEADDGSLSLMLLADLRDLFHRRTADRLRTEEIIAELTSRDERPWPESRKDGKPLNARQLAALLRPYGVRSRQFRRNDPSRAPTQGYVRRDLEQVFLRYLPPSDPLQPLHEDGERSCDDIDPLQGARV